MSRSRFVLTCHDAGGTVPPMLALAEALVATGHEVTLLSQPSVRRRAEAAGCGFVAFSAIPDYAPGTAIEDQLDVSAPLITGAAVGDDLIGLTRSAKADLVVVDANLGGGLAAAEALPQPSVVLLHSMYTTFVDVWFAEFWPLFEPAINQTRAGYRLAPADGWPSVFAKHDLLLSVVPSSFDVPVPDVPAAMRHFGFLVPRGPAALGTVDAFPPGDGPAVLVGLSTTYQGHERLLQRILDALAQTAVRGLVTTAGQVGAAELQVSPNVRVADFLPHRQLLPVADAMVTHAGLGSIAAALSHGVPLVCTPIGRDQPRNAQRVAELGAGVALPETATADAIAEALQQVVTGAAHRQAAEAVARLSAGEGEAAAAAAELVALAD